MMTHETTRHMKSIQQGFVILKNELEAIRYHQSLKIVDPTGRLQEDMVVRAQELINLLEEAHEFMDEIHDLLLEHEIH